MAIIHPGRMAATEVSFSCPFSIQNCPGEDFQVIFEMGQPPWLIELVWSPYFLWILTANGGRSRPVPGHVAHGCFSGTVIPR